MGGWKPADSDNLFLLSVLYLLQEKKKGSRAALRTIFTGLCMKIERL